MKALIIKKTPVNEYDEQVVCYTQEQGKIIAVAKSILKSHSKQAMHIDLLNLVDFELINGSASWRMPIVTGAQASKTYFEIKSSLPKTAAAGFFMEVVDKIVYEHQSDPALWNFILDILDKIERVKLSELMPVFRAGQLRLLEIMGYGRKDVVSSDDFFEHISNRRFISLNFLYSVLQ